MPKFTDEQKKTLAIEITARLDRGMRLKEIGKELGVSDNTIVYWMKKFNIKGHYNWRIIPTPEKGSKFGRWEYLGEELVSKRNGSNKTDRLWKCRCECGTVKFVASQSLYTNKSSSKSNSCGCFKFEGLCTRKWMGYGELSGNYVCQTRNNAIKRGLVFDVDTKFLWDLFIEQNRKCAISGIELSFPKKGKTQKEKNTQTASLDRIDSSIGYVPGNVQWIHKDMQPIKWNYRQDKFLEYIKTIYEYQKSLGNI